MVKIYKYIFLLILIFTPTYVLGADLDIICYDNQKPSVVSNNQNLFNISGFLPGQASIKTVNIQNHGNNSSCRVFIKGEGNRNNLTDKLYFAIENVYGNIVDGKATSNKNISNFLVSSKVQVANLPPNTSIDRKLIITFYPNSDNSLTDLETQFNIRVISEWGESISDNNEGDIRGVIRSTIKPTVNYYVYGIGGPDEIMGEEVKGVNECEEKIKLFGYVFIDNNSNGIIDRNEKIVENVKLNIFTNTNGENITIEKTKTNNAGYWEALLCSGNYFIEIDRGTLPTNTDITENIIAFTLGVEDVEYQLDIGLDDNRGFGEKNLLWIILAIITVLLFSTLLYRKLRNIKG
jgi:hypothetical protein